MYNFNTKSNSIGESDDNNADLEDEFGLGLRYQQAIGHRAFWQLDAFATKASGQSADFGIRLEFQFEL